MADFDEHVSCAWKTAVYHVIQLVEALKKFSTPFWPPKRIQISSGKRNFSYFWYIARKLVNVFGYKATGNKRIVVFDMTSAGSEGQEDKNDSCPKQNSRTKLCRVNFCVVSCLRITVFKSPRIMSTPESGTYFKFRNLLIKLKHWTRIVACLLLLNLRCVCINNW